MKRVRAASLSCLALMATLPALTGCDLALSNPPASQPQSQPSTAPATQPDESATGDTRIIKPFEDVVVRLNGENNTVEIKAWTCLDSGLLEQVACSPQTREHESLLLIKAKPSQIHAALLMAGFEPGSPGKWVYENEQFRGIAPKGEKLSIAVEYADPKNPAQQVRKEIREWIRATANNDAELRAAKPFPKEPWIFAGSAIAPNQQHMGPGEHYVADMSGSIIGLVTFGDEVIGFSQVHSDQEAVEEPVWEVNPETVPPPDTPVTIIIQRWKSDAQTQ
jgi:hypothetical protein